MIHDPEAPMTQAQADILRELCQATGTPFDPEASRERAEVLIDSLRARLEHDLEPGAGDNPDMS